MDTERTEHPAGQPKGGDDLEEVNALSPDMRGRWEVRTRYGTTHIWDLDAGTYTRQPGPGGGPMSGDRVPHPITKVEVWPRVGEHSYVLYDDPTVPELFEHFRRSSTITTIRRAPLLEPGER